MQSAWNCPDWGRSVQPTRNRRISRASLKYFMSVSIARVWALSNDVILYLITRELCVMLSLLTLLLYIYITTSLTSFESVLVLIPRELYCKSILARTILVRLNLEILHDFTISTQAVSCFNYGAN